MLFFMLSNGDIPAGFSDIWHLPFFCKVLTCISKNAGVVNYYIFIFFLLYLFSFRMLLALKGESV